MKEMAESLKAALIKSLNELEQMSVTELLESRYAKLMSYGQFKE